MDKASDTYRTLAKPSEGILFKDKKSKFFGYAYPILSEDDVKPIIESLRKKHHTAGHVCYAWQLGVETIRYRANDDGEPNGSAGLPILNQIKSKEVTNTFVVVVRYFGGTKLGVSGLINAYKEATKDALGQAKIVTKIPMATVSIQFAHSKIGDVERLIRQNNWVIKTQDFGMDCQWIIETPLDQKQQAEDAFHLLLG